MQETNENWDYIASPIGPITVPGFTALRALSDEELCEKMNRAPFVDPAALAVASKRVNMLNYYNGRDYVWGTLAQFQAWKAQQPSFFDTLLKAVSEQK